MLNALKFYGDFGICEIEKCPNGEYRGICTVCGERTFYFNEVGQFCCHYCREREGTQGNAITFLSDFHDVDDKAISTIVNRYSVNNTHALNSSLSCSIEGGYFMVPRRIFNFPIWRGDPHLLKLYIYFLGKARHNHNPKEYNKLKINRGEHVTSISTIAEDNKYKGQDGRLRKWSKSTVSRLLEKLAKSNLIKKIDDTYGMHVSVSNYEVYQDPNNYQKKTPTETNYIEGGYFILARKIFISKIWSQNPHNLKLFIYLVGNAKHSTEPIKYNGVLLQRGSLVRSHSEISDDNEYINGCIRKWSMSEISKMIKKLKNLNLITATNINSEKLLINICKYDTYQNPQNYTTKQHGNNSETTTK